MPIILVVPALLLALTACDDGNALEPGVHCGGVVVEQSGDECSVVATACDDGRLHELLCYEDDDGFGVYERRVSCACAEDRAVYGTTSIEGATCDNVYSNPATLEAAFRACGRDVALP